MSGVRNWLTRKKGRDLHVGDALEFLGQLHTIDRFERHPGLEGDIARIARSGDWSMTVFDGESYEVLNVRDQ